MENDKSGIPNIDTVPVKRRLGFFSGVSIIVGSIIGSGIFVSPKGVLVNSGSVGLCLLIWFVCGLISASGAVIYAELGLLIPRSGGDFNYLLNVFGTFPAFMFAWCQFLILPASSVVLSLTLAEYFSKVIFDDCGTNNLILKLFASAVIISTGIINCISVRLAARTHILFSVLKVAGLFMIIIGGLIKIFKGEFGSMSSGFEGSSTNPTSIAMAIYSGLFTYGGWQNLNHVLEELDNPKRNLPLCVITSITLVTVIYSLVNIAYFSVLSKDEFLSSWAVAVTWTKHEISSAVIIVPIIVACSSYGTLTIAFFISSRLSFAAARAGLFPEILSYLNVNSNVPVPSTVLIVIISVVMTIPADIGVIINVISFIFWIFIGVNMVAFMVLRYKMKDVKTSIKVPLLMPFILLLICIFLVVAPFLEPVRTEFWYALGYLLLGAILYIPFVFFRFRLPGMNGVTRFCQSLMIVAPTTKPSEIS